VIQDAMELAVRASDAAGIVGGVLRSARDDTA